MAQRNYCFDIEPQWGSHAAVLKHALASLPADSLVIEHGAGMYSSPLIARYPVRVICIEEAPGWRSWAKWLYGNQVTMLSRAKEAIPHLTGAALVFIDGAARERSDLLKWTLSAGVPRVIAHDTQDPQYGYDLRDRAEYALAHEGATTRTTHWWRQQQ